MGLSCLFGHNWTGLKCKRCGKTREAIKVLCESPLYKCDVCKITGQRIVEIEKEKANKMKQMNAGLYFDMNARAMLFCKGCKTFICSACALAGHEMKRCPRCQAYFDFDSFTETTKDPLEMLALVTQK
jgi:hypothetical protein